MMKEVVRGIESGALGMIGLLAFIVAFVTILVYVMRMRKSDRTAAKNMPLEDDLHAHHLMNGIENVQSN